MIRTLVETIGKSLGLVIIPDWRAAQLDAERHLSRLYRYLDVDCVFDVGANIGQYGQMLRKYVGYRNRIISFEPNPTVFRQLQVTASDDAHWHVEPIALGNTPGMAQFNAYERSEFGSFRKFGNLAQAPQNMDSTTVSVETRTVESYLVSARRQWNFKRPFLKIDTQGFDLEVAKGAGKTLREFVGLQSEIAFQNIYDGAPDYRESLEYYQSFGFVISRVVPIHEMNFPRLLEMDVIMIRGDLIKSDS